MPNMAKGTSAGLLEEQHAQSVYKLAILQQYVSRFVAMTGKGYGSVVLVDGYAGTGYIGSSPGSAHLMSTTAASFRGITKTKVLLCERDKAHFASLKTMADGFTAQGLDVSAHPGDVEKFLPTAITESVGSALFLFLDPCGAQLPFETIVKSLTDPRRNGLPTEALLNFSADLVRRVGGALVAREDDADGVQLLNTVCHGDWWQEIVRRLGPAGGADNYAKVVDAVATGYATRLRNATGLEVMLVPVSRRIGHQPVYHLVFLTRNDFGISTFADSVARARPDWLAATADVDAPEELDLLGMGVGATSAPDARRAEAVAEQRRTVPEVAANLLRLATTHGSFRPFKHIIEVYGSTLGVATETQIGQALRGLIAAGQMVTREASAKHPSRGLYASLPATRQP